MYLYVCMSVCMYVCIYIYNICMQRESVCVFQVHTATCSAYPGILMIPLGADWLVHRQASR